MGYLGKVEIDGVHWVRTVFLEAAPGLSECVQEVRRRGGAEESQLR